MLAILIKIIIASQIPFVVTLNMSKPARDMLEIKKKAARIMLEILVNLIRLDYIALTILLILEIIDND